MSFPQCPTCGCDLEGIAPEDQCPECGRCAHDESQEHGPGPRDTNPNIPLKVWLPLLLSFPAMVIAVLLASHYLPPRFDWIMFAISILWMLGFAAFMARYCYPPDP